MTRPKKNSYAPAPRLTVDLRGTVSRSEVLLSHEAHLAIAYSRRWFKAGPGEMGQDVHASGVVRRALQLLVQHLANTNDPHAEAQAIRRCCGAIKPDEAERDAAWQRLEGHQEGQPLPSWSDVLHGPGHAEKWAKFNAEHEALVEQLLAERPTRMRLARAAKKTTT